MYFEPVIDAVKIFILVFGSLVCLSPHVVESSEKVFIPEPVLELEISRSLGVSPSEITESLLGEKLKILELSDSQLSLFPQFRSFDRTRCVAHVADAVPCVPGF